MLLSRSVQMIKNKMNPGVFVQVLNPMTGKMEWKTQPEDYDYQQELARAAFADMLHDSERNKMYYDGLRSAIALKRSQGQPVHVLDIGTGTGLLSMMAAQIGADSITAIEEFLPMANRAQKIIRDNGFGDQIKLVRKRSTSVQVGPGYDMEQRANILVTEVFDTELIGEGAISTFNHAHDNLLTEDCLVVPHSGRVYAQVISSSLCSNWNGLHDIPDVLKIPSKHQETGAKSLALHDLQLSQMKESEGHFKALSDPLVIFDFDFGKLKKKPIPKRRQAVHEIALKDKLKCDAIFMWWDLIFDPQGEIVLTCAPTWAQNSSAKVEELPWRDHWMQAIYYPISRPEATDKLFLISNHDEYSYWFDLSKTKPSSLIEMPDPQAGIHLAVSRTRVGQINDPTYNSLVVGAVQSLVAKKDTDVSKVLVLSEQTLLPLIAAKLFKNNTKVVCFELNEQFRQALENIAEHNGISKRLEIRHDVNNFFEVADKVESDFDLILAEPSFNISLLPWHNLFFWYMLKSIRTSKTLAIMPIKAVIWTCPVTFEHLWKIRAPLNVVEGFDLSHFDEVIMNACNVSDAEVEPEPLWEYPCSAQALPKKVMTLDFNAEMANQKTVTKFDGLNLTKRGAGMAFWMEWYLTDEHIFNTGPQGPVELGVNIKWNMHQKQGVHFFVEKSDQVKINDIGVEVEFKDGELSFAFETM